MAPKNKAELARPCGKSPKCEGSSHKSELRPVQRVNVKASSSRAPASTPLHFEAVKRDVCPMLTVFAFAMTMLTKACSVGCSSKSALANGLSQLHIGTTFAQYNCIESHPLHCISRDNWSLLSCWEGCFISAPQTSMIDILPFPFPPAAWTGNFSSESLLSSSFSPALHCHKLWYYFLSSHSPPVQHLDGIKGKMVHSFSLNWRTKWPPIYTSSIFFRNQPFSGRKYKFPQKWPEINLASVNLKGESWHAKKRSEKEAFFSKIRGIKSPTLRDGSMELKYFPQNQASLFGKIRLPGYIHVQPGAHSISIEEVSTTVLTLSTCLILKICIYYILYICIYYIYVYIIYITYHKVYITSKLSNVHISSYLASLALSFEYPKIEHPQHWKRFMEYDMLNSTTVKNIQKSCPQPKKETRGMKSSTVWPWFLDWSLSKGFPSWPTENWTVLQLVSFYHPSNSGCKSAPLGWWQYIF